MGKGHASRTSRPLLALIGATFASVLATGNAYAQGDDKAAADALFEQGRTLLTQGDLAHACPKLEESLRLDRGIGTMLYLAECYQREGKTASAWAEFREAEDLAAKENDPRRSVAQDRAAKLEPSLSYMVVRVDRPAAGITVARDGHEIGAPAWGTETPIDPGDHEIEATAPGRVTWKTRVQVGATGDHRTVSVPALALAEVATRHTSRDVVVARGWQRVLGVGMIAVGVVGVGVGTAFGITAISKNDSANDHCPASGCDPQGIDLGHTANQDGNIATVAFIAGGALILGGAIVYLTAKHTVRLEGEAPFRAFAANGTQGLGFAF